MAKWKLLETEADLGLMVKVLGVQEPVAAVMANRGLRSKKAAVAYLRPGLEILGDMLEMKDVTKAFDRIIEAIRLGQRIMIYGDYDVDGVMSTVILYKALKACDGDVDYYIPHREEEGYGLNLGAIRNLREAEVDLLITCDNGIASLVEIEEAQKIGMDVIVIDHHEPGFVENDNGREDVLPNAVAVIDPKQSACPYPFKEMCAGGLAFRLMWAFFQYTKRDFSRLFDELLSLSAIATVCDIVDLMGENRVMVKSGLAALNANKHLNVGLGQLISLKGYTDKPIDTFTLGFVVGPCINATGRLESAEMSVRLLISDDAEERMTLARKLSDLNDERKELTKKCVERALESLKAGITDKVIVLEDIETHESIAGIVAGRVKDTLNRPTIMLTKGADMPDHPGVSIRKGSGRSIEGYNLFEALYAHRNLTIRFGGHSMAAGLSLAESNVAILRERLNADCTLEESDFQAILNIDRELSPEEITLKLANELAWLSPFGKGNHAPLFCTRGLNCIALRVINEKSTLIFTFDAGGRKLKGIAFGLNDQFSEALREKFDESTYRRLLSGHVTGLVMDVAYAVESNTYNGQTSVQIRIKDFLLA